MMKKFSFSGSRQHSAQGGGHQDWVQANIEVKKLLQVFTIIVLFFTQRDIGAGKEGRDLHQGSSGKFVNISATF